ncbi:MAG: sugar phosphate isomerase/epimerase family protein [Candidatus Zipacnadales bacterium]
MKSCFSTLGCPGWSIDRIALCVEECCYSGVELRGLQNEMYLPHHPALLPKARLAFRERFASLGCVIACLGSSAYLTAPPGVARDRGLSEVRDFIDLAYDLGCPTVRLFPGRIYEGDSRETSRSRMIEALIELEPVARAAGVRLAVETHDDWCRATDLSPVIRSAGSAFIGILWDINHPYRHGEAPAVTAREVSDMLVHVHTKDSLANGAYKLFGEGELPLRDILSLLHGLRYTGYLSFEWEKKWYPELAEPEVALPHYARALSAMLCDLGIEEE